MKSLARFFAIGCGSIAFGGLCLLGLSCNVLVANAGGGPSEAVTELLADVRDDDWQSALQRMSSDYQSSHAAADLQRQVEGTEGLDALETHSVAMLTSVETEDDSATVDVMLDGTTPMVVELTRAADYWYIDLVAVSGVPLR